MQMLSIVKDLNIIEDILFNHLNYSIFFLINILFFHQKTIKKLYLSINKKWT